MSNITGIVEFTLGTLTLTLGESLEVESYKFEKTAVIGLSGKINRQRKPAIQKIKVQLIMDESYDRDFIENAKDETIVIVQDTGRRLTMNNVEYESTPTEDHAAGMAEVQFAGNIIENTGINV